MRKCCSRLNLAVLVLWTSAVLNVFPATAAHATATAHTTATANDRSLHQQDSSLADFEAQVRLIAQKTAEEDASRERARLKAEREQAAKGPFTFYKYSEDGNPSFSGRRPLDKKYQVVVYNSCYACGALSSVNWNLTKLYLTDFSSTISRAASQYGIDPALVRAVIHAESNFNPLARSRKGASGLMQLMPGTAKDMGVKDVWDVEANIFGGTKYLAYLLERFKQDITLATAAYNAGPGNVNRYGGVPPFSETKTYVFRVNILHQRYKLQASVAQQ